MVILYGQILNTQNNYRSKRRGNRGQVVVVVLVEVVHQIELHVGAGLALAGGGRQASHHHQMHCRGNPNFSNP